MGVRGVLIFIALALLCCTFPAAGALVERNDDLAKLFWIHCGVALNNAREAVEDLGLHIPGEKSGINSAIISRSTLLAKEDIQKAICVLHPVVKQTLLDCLSKKNLLFLVSGEEDGSKHWNTKYLEFLFARTDAPRRRKLLQSLTPSPAPSTAPSPAPSTAPSPAPSLAPSPSSSQVPDAEPSAKSPARPFFPPNFNRSNSQPTAGEESAATPDSASNIQPKKENSHHKSVVIAVVVTATVTFIFAMLLCFCYFRICRTGSGAGKNDQRPLLSLSSSGYSVGPSNKSFALGNTINNGKLDNQSFNTSLNNNKMASSMDSNIYLDSENFNTSIAGKHSLGAIAGAAKTTAVDSAQILPFSQKPSPGRLGNPPGLAPLKPPPGREVLSSPEQPPPRPPPGKANPAPPPAPVPPPSLKPTSSGPRPPPPPPIPSGMNTAPRPPPPPRPGAPPPPPRPGAPPPPRPPVMGSKPPRPSHLGPHEEGEADGPKTKLKPFFWDKVLANPDHSMVWHQIKSGSFQFNEEMIETLFGYAPPDKNKNDARRDSSSQGPSTQYIQIIDLKKAQNLSILLRALNVTTEEVCDALQEGNELPSEFLETLLKMAPTSEEEMKLRLFSGELSQLGPADRFLKVLVDIPFAFKRMESLLFMGTLQEELSIIKDSFATLEAACTELRKSRLFLKLLEAVLKTGNRMNDGTFRGGAQAFKLDTLLKLSDVKGTDGKTTLLHFVVREIIRSEGIKAARATTERQSTYSIKSDDLLEDPSPDSEEHYRSLGLQVVSGLSGELENVKKAAVLDADSITGTVAKLGNQLLKARNFLNSEMRNVDAENGFHLALRSFVQNAEVDIMSMLEEDKRIMALIKSTADYFHGKAGKDEGLRLFVIVRDFLIILDKVCKEVKDAPRKPHRTPKNEGSTVKPSSEPSQPPDSRQRLFPAIRDRRVDSSSSDDDST